MKKFRVLSILLVAVLMCSCFVGCGKDDTVDSDVTTITVWSSSSHSKNSVMKIVDSFNNNEGKEKGIFIDYQVIEGDSYSKSLELALQTGQGPDLFTGGVVLKNAVENGYVAAFEDFEGGEEFVEGFKDYLVDFKHTYRGKTYAVPTSATTRGLIYNKDMFREAGLVDENGEPTPPETFEEFREYAKILTDKKNNKFGTIFPMKWSGWVGSDITSMQIQNQGFMCYNPVTSEYDFSGLEPVIDCMMGIIDDGSVYPGSDGIDNDQARAYFAEGMIGMKISYSFDVGVLTDQFPAKCDWGVAPLPVVDKDNVYCYEMTPAGGPMINAASLETKDANKIFEALKVFCSDEYAIELYKDGIQIPVNPEITESVEIDESKTGWKEFAEMTKISVVRNMVPQSDMTGYQTLEEMIATKVLSKDKTAAEVLKEYAANVTEGTKKYYDMYSDDYDNLAKYTDKSWDIKR